MFDFTTTKEVKKLIDSKDNIIDQLILLRENRHRFKGIQRLIDKVISVNQSLKDWNSEYILYAVVKYYYELDVVKEVSVPVLPLIVYETDQYDVPFIRSLIESTDNIIDQFKILGEHKDSIDVQKYIEYTIDCFNDYDMYCLNKYYYGKKARKVKPSLKLYAYLKERIVSEPIPNVFSKIEEIQVNDQVKILTGPFTGLTGRISKIDLENRQATFIAELFGQEETLPIDEEDNKFLKVDDPHE